MKTIHKKMLFAGVLCAMSAMAEQPDEFLAHVQSDGTQYFDTGVIGKAYTKAEIDYVPEVIPGDGHTILGSKSTSIIAPWFNNYGFGLHYWGQFINKVGRDVGVRRTLINTVEPGNQTVEWIQGSTNFVATKSGEYSTGLSMYLFALNDNGTATLCSGKLRLYGLKIWQKDSAEGEYELVRDYRPARKDGRTGLYDAVNETIIYPKASDGSDTTIAPTIRRVYSTEHDGMTPIQQLTNAVAKAASGDIIVLERGVYTFPDDVYMADNRVNPSSVCYCKFRLNVTKPGIVICGEDASSRKTWTHEDEPVVINGNGGKAIQIQLDANQSARIENITFANCDGGAYGSSSESLYGNYCMGGAIGVGNFANNRKGGDNVVITNCAFRGNHAGIGGAIGANSGIVKYLTIQDCFFTNNVSDSDGGAVCSGNIFGCDFIGNGTACNLANYVGGCRFIANDPNALGAGASHILSANDVYDCLFVTNMLKTADWYYIAQATNFYNCHFTNNNGGAFGALGSLNGIVTNCTLHGNASGAQGRGAVNDAALVVDCRITCNGGYSAGGLVVRTAGTHTYVKDCYIAGNWASKGGCGANFLVNCNANGNVWTAEDFTEPIFTFDHCVFETNFVESSSGAHGGAVLINPSNLPEGILLESLAICSNGCQFIENSANHAAGVEGVTAIGCTFEGNRGGAGFNYLGGDAALSRLVDCELTGGNIYMCSVDRSWVHGVTTLVFNVGCHVTNTLVNGCVLELPGCGVIGRYATATAPAYESEFVNCTFAANKGNFFYQTNIVSLVNCAFFGNTNFAGTATAVCFSNNADNNGFITFDTCAFGPLAAGVPALVGTDLYMDEVPRFAGGRRGYEAEPYYSPLWSSPLVGKGKVLVYTAEDTDLAGRLRLRDGLIDIGCYQCWINPPGFILMVK